MPANGSNRLSPAITLAHTSRGRNDGMIPWSKSLLISQPDGLRLGGSEAVMIRDLILVSGNVTRTKWYLDGQPPPHVSVPGHVDMRWLSFADWRADKAILDTPAETVARRFSRGASCLVGWDGQDQRVIYHLWVSERGTYTPWIFKVLEPLAEHLIIFDVWAHPDYRGKNVHWAGASMACEEVVRSGAKGICAGLEAHEFLPFATKYASFGLGLITPYASILGFKLFGLKAHFHRPPPERLCAFGCKLHARYPDTYLESGDSSAQRD